MLALEIICNSRIHCATCREVSAAGRGWRESLGKHFDTGDHVDFACPHGIPWGGNGDPTAAAAEASRLAEENKLKLAIAGREHWERAHRKRSWTEAEFEDWRAGIPSFGCKCREDADQYIAANPPPIGDDDAMFIWFWRFHDKKNRELGKTIMTLEAARLMYGRPITEPPSPAA